MSDADLLALADLIDGRVAAGITDEQRDRLFTDISSNEAVNALRARLDRMRDAGQLNPGDRVELTHGRTATVAHTADHGRNVRVEFHDIAEPWFGPADAPFTLAN